MKRLALLLPLALATAPAFAADAIIDSPPEAPVAFVEEIGGWTGLYVGVQGGYGFGDTGELDLDPFEFPGLIAAFTPAGDPAGSSFTGEGDFDDGFVGGVHIGYDWQVGNIVFGGILDVVGTDIGDEQRAFSRTPAEYVIERELDLLATLRARVGYAFSDRVLAYATGGVAYGDVDFSYRQPGSGAAFETSGDGDDFGYTIGAGIETKVTQRISLGFEYLYTDLGDNDFEANLTGGPFGGATGAAGSNPDGTTLSGSDEDFDFHTVQLKLSYRF